MPWTTYRLFGITLRSNLELTNVLGAPGAVPDVTFTCYNHPAEAPIPLDAACLFTGETLTKKGVPISHLYHFDDTYVLSLTDIANFYVRGDRIWTYVENRDRAPLIEIYLLSSGLGLWHELQGVPIIHASVVSVAGRGIAFLAHSGHGKSGLAASLVQKGHPLVTDDNLHLLAKDEDFYAYPGYPQMRMWPDEVDYFLGPGQDLAPVIEGVNKRRVPVGVAAAGGDGFGTFCPKPVPLRALYVPERVEAGDAMTEIVPLRPAEAVMAVIRHLFMPRTVHGIGLHPERLTLFSNLVEQVPVRRLRYPSGFNHLPAVRDAILNDLRHLNTLETQTTSYSFDS